METQTWVESMRIQSEVKKCKETVFCPGGTIYKTKMACGCCFCEKGSCFCEWHEGAGGCWS